MNIEKLLDRADNRLINGSHGEFVVDGCQVTETVFCSTVALRFSMTRSVVAHLIDNIQRVSSVYNGFLIPATCLLVKKIKKRKNSNTIDCTVNGFSEEVMGYDCTSTKIIHKFILVNIIMIGLNETE